MARQLGLGIFLILLASAALLGIDWWLRGGSSHHHRPRVALIQHSSVAPLDDGVRGILEVLRESGYAEGKNLELKRFDATGDQSLASSIAVEACSGRFDLIVTVSTLSLQSVASANRDTRVRHVFGIVADPFGAGVGINPKNHREHPAWMVGQGILFPVEECFEIARQCHPGLRKVGVAWNTAESNSETFTRMARGVCQRMGIELIEREVESTSAIPLAIESMISAGVQAIWVGGDVLVTQAIDSIIARAREAGIPVFTIIPGKPERGTLFDIGVDFYEAGREEGKLVVRVLQGEDPATIPVEDILDRVPRRFVVNRKALEGLSGWSLPDQLVERASIVVDADGVHQQAPPAGKSQAR